MESAKTLIFKRFFYIISQEFKSYPRASPLLRNRDNRGDRPNEPGDQNRNTGLPRPTGRQHDMAVDNR
jgi:hypothetical protein